jgi:hypothetical protein
MPPATALWNPATQAGTRAFRYRIRSCYSITGLFPDPKITVAEVIRQKQMAER